MFTLFLCWHNLKTGKVYRDILVIFLLRMSCTKKIFSCTIGILKSYS